MVDDSKAENIAWKKTDEDTKQQLKKLQKENEILNKRVIDLKARSMCDNLIFYNLPESKDEDTTNLIYGLEIKDARVNLKIDRSHRLSKPKSGMTRLRPIVADTSQRKAIEGHKVGNRRAIPRGNNEDPQRTISGILKKRGKWVKKICLWEKSRYRRASILQTSEIILRVSYYC